MPEHQKCRLVVIINSRARAADIGLEMISFGHKLAVVPAHAMRTLIEFRNHFCSFVLAIERDREMVNSLMLLAFEANGVIALRMMKLMRGGRSARREAELMVSEKIHAAFEASASLMAGASGEDIVHRYRRHVAANAKRLGGLKSSPNRKRARRRTRSRRK